MSKQLSALCNKCGWYGKADPGLSMIEHPGCNYSACYSPTEVKLHDLIEAIEPIMKELHEEDLRYIEDDDELRDYHSVRISVAELRTLRSALAQAKGGER